MTVSAETRIDTGQFGPASFIVCAIGDLDDQCDALRARLMPLVEIDEARVVLDLGAAFGVGAAAVALMADVAAALGARHGRRLVIVTRDARLSRELAATDLDGCARIETTLTQGLAHAAA